MRNPVASLIFSMSLATSGSALAQVDNITRGELALLPEVCMDVQAIPVTGWTQHSKESPRSPYWVARMGRTFWAMHHYCWALLHLTRAKQPGVPENHRTHMIRTAIADFGYVVNHAQPDFVLLPELFYRIGLCYQQLQEFTKALDAFDESKKAKADYWPAYAGLADVQAIIGRRAEALAALDEGLKAIPDEPNLVAARKRIEAGRGGPGVKGGTPAR